MLGVEPWLGKQALEARLKSCRSPRILHIATHGFFLPDPAHRPEQGDSRLGRLSDHHLDNPLLRSGLALAGANTWLKGQVLPPEAEDGILTAEDVSGLDLLETELVVLSACETGLGEVYLGEGVYRAAARLRSGGGEDTGDEPVEGARPGDAGADAAVLPTAASGELPHRCSARSLSSDQAPVSRTVLLGSFHLSGRSRPLALAGYQGTMSYAAPAYDMS